MKSSSGGVCVCVAGLWCPQIRQIYRLLQRHVVLEKQCDFPEVRSEDVFCLGEENKAVCNEE